MRAIPISKRQPYFRGLSWNEPSRAWRSGESLPERANFLQIGAKAGDTGESIMISDSYENCFRRYCDTWPSNTLFSPESNRHREWSKNECNNWWSHISISIAIIPTIAMTTIPSQTFKCKPNVCRCSKDSNVVVAFKPLSSTAFPGGLKCIHQVPSEHSFQTRSKDMQLFR